MVQKSQTLDEYQSYRYNFLIGKQKLGSRFDLAMLPPTSAAAKQHFLRVYLQVKEWKGSSLQAKNWDGHNIITNWCRFAQTWNLLLLSYYI